MNDIVKSILPVIANALLPGAGALVGFAETWLGGKMGIPPDQVQSTIAGMSPADLIKLKELDNGLAQHMADNGIALDLAQIATNTEEAKSESVFVAGARPFILWVGGISLAYVGLVEPLARFVVQVGFHYTGAFPTIDTSLTMQLVGGILGLSGLRSWDKKK